MIKELVQSYLDLNPKEDKRKELRERVKEGKTFLYFACREGREDVVKLLLELDLAAIRRKSIIYTSRKGDHIVETSLDVSARWGYTNIVKILLHACKEFSGDEIEKASRLSDSCCVIHYLKQYKKAYEKVTCFC